MDKQSGHGPATIVNARIVGAEEWQALAALAGAVAFAGVPLQAADDVNRDGTSREAIVKSMLAGEEVGFEREWEDVFVLSKMGRIGKLPANFLFFAKSGLACLARLAQGAPKPALDLAYSPSKECRALVFAVESRLAPCDMPVLCAKLDIEPKVWTEDDGSQDAPAGKLFVNYFDKTLGEVPAEVLPELKQAMERTQSRVAAFIGKKDGKSLVAFLDRP